MSPEWLLQLRNFSAQKNLAKYLTLKWGCFLAVL